MSIIPEIGHERGTNDCESNNFSKLSSNKTMNDYALVFPYPTEKLDSTLKSFIWSVQGSLVCKIHWRLWTLFHVVLTLSKPLRTSLVSKTAETFDSQSWVSDSCPSSEAIDMHCQWFPARMKRLYSFQRQFGCLRWTVNHLNVPYRLVFAEKNCTVEITILLFVPRDECP